MLRSLGIILKLRVPLDGDLYVFPVACQLAPPRGEHLTPRRGALYYYVHEMNLFWTTAFWIFRSRSLFSLSRLRGRQGTRLKPGCKCRSRPGSMARTPGVQGREIRDTTTGRLSEHAGPSRPMQTHVQVKKMSDGLRMLFRILLTPLTDCLTTSCSCLSRSLSGCTPRTGHGPYRLRPSVWLHSKLPFLCGKPCVMNTITRNLLMDNGAISTAA